MMWTIEEIRWSFSGRLIGSQLMRDAVCKTLHFLPPSVIKYITSNVWFISSPEDAWAFTFRGSDVQGQYIIFLSDELFEENDKHVRYTILHEIGHILLRHRNSMGYKQSPKEVEKQEQEADHFAKKYLSFYL